MFQVETFRELSYLKWVFLSSLCSGYFISLAFPFLPSFALTYRRVVPFCSVFLSLRLSLLSRLSMNTKMLPVSHDFSLSCWFASFPLARDRQRDVFDISSEANEIVHARRSQLCHCLRHGCQRCHFFFERTWNIWT